MKFADLQKKMLHRTCFRVDQLGTGSRLKPHERVLLNRWTGQGKLIRLRRGYYTLAPEYRSTPPSALEIAAFLYRPSYISLQWALSHYGLIPEASAAITSITTLKTARFSNGLGEFHYAHVLPAYFFGFERIANPPYWLAWPEKALLDFIYVSIPKSETLSANLLMDNYRLQNLDQLHARRLRECVGRFGAARIQRAGTIVLSLIRHA